MIVIGEHDGRTPPMVRVYLKRLRKIDASRDWLAMAPKFSEDMLYGDFMGLMNECQDRLNKHARQKE